MSFCLEEMEKKELPSQVFQLVPSSFVSLYFQSYKPKSQLKSEMFKHLNVSRVWGWDLAAVIARDADTDC